MLDVIGIETTLRCDQACVFCGSRAGRRGSEELTTSELVDIFEQAVKMGARSIDLTGGETYLREDWLDLLRAIRALGVESAIVTAGHGIDESVAKQAADAGLSRVAVSIDGPAEIHDSLRRTPNSYEHARRAVESFRNAGVPVSCNTQLNARNWRALPQLADVLVGAGLYGWQLQLMIPMGRASEVESLVLQPYEFLEIIPLVARVIERCAAEGLKIAPADNLGYFGPHEHWLRKTTSKRGHSVGCAAGVSLLGIDAAGNVTGCSALDASEVCAGNVRKHSLQELWDTAPELRMGLSLSHVWGFCATCYYSRVCRGGCSATAIALTGRRGNNPYCHHRALEWARQGMGERLVRRSEVHEGRRGHALFDIEVGPLRALP
jgi:radical SAM protein with 4Fe4S-binding SPASM domain